MYMVVSAINSEDFSGGAVILRLDINEATLVTYGELFTLTKNGYTTNTVIKDNKVHLGKGYKKRYLPIISPNKQVVRSGGVVIKSRICNSKHRTTHFVVVNPLGQVAKFDYADVLARVMKVGGFNVNLNRPPKHYGDNNSNSITLVSSAKAFPIEKTEEIVVKSSNPWKDSVKYEFERNVSDVRLRKVTGILLRNYSRFKAGKTTYHVLDTSNRVNTLVGVFQILHDKNVSKQNALIDFYLEHTCFPFLFKSLESSFSSIPSICVKARGKDMTFDAFADFYEMLDRDKDSIRTLDNTLYDLILKLPSYSYFGFSDLMKDIAYDLIYVYAKKKPIFPTLVSTEQDLIKYSDILLGVALLELSRCTVDTKVRACMSIKLREYMKSILSKKYINDENVPKNFIRRFV